VSFRLHQRPPGITLSEFRVYNTCPQAKDCLHIGMHPLRSSVSAKHRQTGENRNAENSYVCVGVRECDQAEVAHPVGLLQHRRWRSPAGKASQVEEAPTYCMALSAAGRMTDGSVARGKEKYCAVAKELATEVRPAWPSANLNSALLLTAC
jgi:hypothetical protein